VQAARTLVAVANGYIVFVALAGPHAQAHQVQQWGPARFILQVEDGIPQRLARAQQLPGGRVGGTHAAPFVHDQHPVRQGFDDQFIHLALDGGCQLALPCALAFAGQPRDRLASQAMAK
jgi:hypothetical protein